MSAADSIPLSQSQARALLDGLAVLAQRLSETGDTATFQSELAGLSQPLDTLIDPGETLKTGLTDALDAATLPASLTVADLRALIVGAAAPALGLASVTASLDSTGSQDVVWLDIVFDSSRTLTDHAIDPGRTPSPDPSTPTLADVGLRIDDFSVDVHAKFGGTVRIGLDTTPGLPPEQAVLFAIDDLEVGALADETVPGVQVVYGVFDMGPSDVRVTVDTRASIDLIEGSNGHVALGTLDAQGFGALFSVAPSSAGAGSADFSVSVPFTLDMGGFAQTGTAQVFRLDGVDGFDPGSIGFGFPSLTLSAGGAFDFTRFGEITHEDLQQWIVELDRLVPRFGEGLELPLVGEALGDGMTLGQALEPLYDALHDAEAQWAFDGVNEFVEKLSGVLGLTGPAALLGLKWNDAAGSIEWTLPWTETFTKTLPFDADAVLPGSLPLKTFGKGEAELGATVEFEITGGVVSDSAIVLPPVTISNRLSLLNRGEGLTKSALIDGSDLRFTLSDGSAIVVDLDPLPGLAPAPGDTSETATVGALLSLLGAAAPGKLAAALDANRLVLTDLTSGPNAFTVSAPTVVVNLGSSTSPLMTTRTSAAPLALGLWGAQDGVDALGHPTLTGSSLASVSMYDRLYLAETTLATPLLSTRLELDATLDAGASLGPLSLSIVDGKASGHVDWSLLLTDPGTGASDGRIFLSELDGVVLKDLFDHQLTSATLDGVFQIAVGPPTLEAKLDIDPTDYVTDPLATPPDTNLVPYLELIAGGAPGDWDFDVIPSEKLKSLFASGLSGFSWHDLPAMLDMLLDALEDTALWQQDLPLTDKTLGELLDLRDRLAGLSLPDLSALLGTSVGGSDPSAWKIGDWKTQLDARWDAALADLRDEFPEFVDRLQSLVWEFGRIQLDWQGRLAGDEDFETAFVARVAAWGNALAQALGEFDAARAASGLALPAVAALSSALAGVHGFVSAIPSGLEAIGQMLGNVFSGLTGLTTTVDLALEPGAPGAAPTLRFDLDLTLVDLHRGFDLGDLAIGGSSPLRVSSEGKLEFVLDGTIETSIGFDFATMTPIFDVAKTKATLNAELETVGDAVIGASLGGLAGVSIGKPGDGFTISLTRADGSSAPASIVFDGAALGSGGSGLSGGAYLAAELPLYVTPIVGKVGTIELASTLDLAVPSLSSSISFDGDLSDIFANGTLGLDGWIDGALLFVDGLIALLETDVVGDLPLLRDVDLSGDGFLKQFRDALADLDGLVKLKDVYQSVKGHLDGTNPLFDAISGTIAIDLEVTGAGRITLDPAAIGNPSAPHYAYWNSSLDDLFDPTGLKVEDLVARLGLTGRTEFTDANGNPLAAGDLDLGLAALDIELEGSAGIDFVVDYGLNIGLGYSVADGFFLEGVAGDEATVSAGLGFSPGSALHLDIGPLRLGLTDGTPGAIVAGGSVSAAQAVANRELHASLGMDLGSGRFGAGGSGLFDSLSIAGEAKAKLDVDLSSNIAGLGMSLETGFYQADGSPLEFTLGPGDGLSLPDADFRFDITSTWIDLGVLLGEPVTRLLGKIDEAFEPLDPVLDLLTSEVPLISDVSEKVGNGPVTFLDAISWFGEGAANAADFIGFLIDVREFVHSAPSGGAPDAYRFELGGLSLLGGPGAPAGPGTPSAPAGLSYKAPSATDASENGALGASLLDPLRELGITFPVLEDPGGQLANFLFGDEADLILWDIPDLDAGFGFRQSFPVFPPLYVAIFGGVDFATNFDLGFDTRGIRLAAADGGTLTDLVKGVYLVDEGRASGNDLEMSMTAVIGAAAELNIAVAQAGVEGGLRGTLGADLKDPDGDGKVYLDEFAYNLALGPECIFDFEGSLSAFLAAYIKLGLSTPFGFVTLYEDRFTLADVTILDWSLVTCPPLDPVLADKSGATLTLNMGPRATLVSPGRTTDGDETFVVDVIRDGDGDPVTGAGAGIAVTAYNTVQNFTGITRIEFDAGAGKDRVIVTPQVVAAVVGAGGDGDDFLTGGSGSNTLSGGAGSDVLSGRAAADVLSGGDGDDFLYGYGGADRLDGGDGDDALFGDDDVGDMVAFNAANPDFLAGSPGNDSLIGGAGRDRLVAGSGSDRIDGGQGDDAIDAGAGDDTAEGGAGNDQIVGGTGSDRLYGDDIAGLVTGGNATTHADRIEGGDGYDEIHGGTGDDILYAADEAQGETAPATGTGPGGYASRIWGEGGADMIRGTAGRDAIDGGNGSDYIASGDGDDSVYGGNGADAIVSGAGNATLLGGFGSDVIDAGAGDDRVDGGPGNDRIFAREGADRVWGGTTAASFPLIEAELAKGVLIALHGGFLATPSEDDCGPEIYFYPEVYPPTVGPITVQVFDDRDRDGLRDAPEPLVPTEPGAWRISVLNADRTATVVSGDFDGGAIQLGEGTLVAGDYWVVVTPSPTNPGWIPSTSIVDASVHVDATGQSVVPQFGYHREGAIEGKVTRQPSIDGPQSPLEGQEVFIDLDDDLRRDPGEVRALTDADGRYRFDDLAVDDYRVVLASTDECLQFTTEAKPGWAFVQVVGGQTVQQDFLVRQSPFPVVEDVSLGRIGQTIEWTPVPDGPAQREPVYAPETRAIAIDLCTADPQGVFFDPKALTFALYDRLTGMLIPTSPSIDGQRLVFEARQMLPPGSYVLELQHHGILSRQGVLDGEWRDAGDFEHGDRFVSGDGYEGGPFVFTFELTGGLTANLASTATDPTEPGLPTDSSDAPVSPADAQIAASTPIGGPVSTSADPSQATDAQAAERIAFVPGEAIVPRQTGVIRGSVWWHDARDGDVARSPSEPGIAGQTVELHLRQWIDQGPGGQVDRLVASTLTDASGAFSFDRLPGGDYVVVQRPTPTWMPAVETASLVGTAWFAVQLSYDKQAPVSKLFTIDPFAFDPESSAQLLLEMPGVTLRDVAAIGGDVYLAGIGQGLERFWRFDTADGSLELLSGAVEGRTLPHLVGLEALDAGTLVGLAEDATLRLFDVGDGTWTGVGRLLDARGRPLYPVGDLAMVSEREAVAVVSLQPYAQDYGLARQMLATFDPTSGALLADLRPIEGAQLALVGLEWTGSRLFALSTDGMLHPLDRETPRIDEIVPVGLGRSPVGGLAIGTLATPQGDEEDGIHVVLPAGATVDAGFGDVPVMRVLPDGDDLIDGGCGPEGDLLVGDDGDDLPSDVLTIGGNDAIRGRDGDDTIAGGLKGDSLIGEAGRDLIDGGIDGPNRIDGGDANDTITGGQAADRVFGGDGDDIVDGGAGRDWIFGEAGRDLIDGGPDDDVLVGGSGADTVLGRTGDDSVIVSNGLLGDDYADDPFGTVGGAEPGVYDGGDGDDLLTIRFDDATAPVQLSLADDRFMLRTDLLLGRGTSGPLFETEWIAGFERAQLAGGAGADTLDAAMFSGSTIQRGGGDDDHLIGAVGVDDADGGDGDDLIEGRSGDDTLAGGAGTNTMEGGAGSDLFPIDPAAAGDSVVENAIPGTDTVDARDADGNLDVVIGTTTTSFTGAMSATFDHAVVEVLLLGAGADRVGVGSGPTTPLSISGGDGRDRLDYSGWNTPVTVDLSAGLATRLASATAFEEIIGGLGNDLLAGDANDNLIAGSGGSDTMIGGAGFDEADYGSAPSAVAVRLATAGPQNTLGAGTDTLIAFEALRGSAFADTLSGNTLANRLRGGDGDDSLDGGAADDTLDGGAGFDLADYRSAPGPVNVRLDLAAPQATGGAGADTLISIEAVAGSPFADLLHGDAAANRLSGEAGNDTLTGDDGNDTLYAGDGVDVAVFERPQSHYTITPIPGGYSVFEPGTGFTDIVIDFERLAFADRTLKLGPDNLPPALAPVVVDYTDTAAPDTFTSSSGVLPATDPDGDPLHFRLVGGTANPDGTLSLDGSLGTLTLDPATGGWRFDPDPAALEARSALTLENFPVETTDLVNTVGGTIGIRLAAVNDVPRLTTPVPIVYNASSGASVFLERSFSLSAFDAESGPLNFGIQGGTASGSAWVRDGVLGTLHLDSASGSALFSPDDTVLGSLAADAGETFVLTASDGLASTSVTLTVTAIAPTGGTITGTPGNDTALAGGAGADTISGLAGDDTMTGGAGNDLLDGGGGPYTDTATFSGPLSGYLLSRTGGTIVVTDLTPGRDGTDTGTQLERLQFADMGINLTVQATAGSIPLAALDRICELYVGFFGRVPAANGLESWIEQHRNGKALGQMADDFYGIGSSVALRSYTGYWDFGTNTELSDADFVKIAYRNVLGREGLSNGISYWAAQLSGVGAKTRGELVSTMLDAAHALKTNADWGWVANLLDDRITMSRRVAVEWGLNYGATAQLAIQKGMAIAGAVDESPNPNPAYSAIPVKTFDFAEATTLVGINPANLDLIA